MERILDRPANYDHDYDGRPPVGWHDDDPLLTALIREHPEKIPNGKAHHTQKPMGKPEDPERHHGRHPAGGAATAGT